MPPDIALWPPACSGCAPAQACNGCAPAPVRTQNVWVQAAALICLVGGFVISYARAKAESIGLECKVGIAERTERMLILLVPAFFYGLGVPYLLPAALIVLAVLVVITVGQRLVHVYRQATA